MVVKVWSMGLTPAALCSVTETMERTKRDFGTSLMSTFEPTGFLERKEQQHGKRREKYLSNRTVWFGAYVERTPEDNTQ